jgi:hypothetical protein
MTEALFWDIVSLLDWSKWDDDRAVLEPAIRRLAKLPIREICLFDEFLHWRLYSLDTREHALHFAPGQPYEGYVNDELPFSTDGFMDCRAMVVAKGQREYESVLGDPTQMARQRFESFAYLARFAYERKTGDGYEYEVGINTWAGCNKAGWIRDGAAEPGAAADPPND